MLTSAQERIESTLPDDALVLDIGGWAKPYARADWVLDIEAYETRGQWDAPQPQPRAQPLPGERFTADTWVVRDICDHRPWPFDDDQFDFVVCAHTLEDVRDPIWVCSEMVRVGRAGYVEVPSRLAEQSWGVQGDWVGWGHHHWLVDIDEAAAHVQFVFKPHILGRNDVRVSLRGGESLTEEQSVASLWWEGGFTFGEELFFDPGEHLAYLQEVLDRHPERLPEARPGRRGLLRRR